MDPVIRPIADFAARLSFDDLPDEIVRHATDHLVDTLACALGGADSLPAAIGRRLAEGTAPPRYACRVLGTRWRAAAPQAAFANGAMIRSLDFNDTYPGGHPSDCLGPILALAEHAGADGPHLLAALVVGYETFVRLLRATRLGERGWDHGIIVGLATAAGLGSLLRLSPEVIGHALAITATSNVSLRVTRMGELSLWKGAATPFSAQSATTATLLAAEGMSGPALSFVGQHGVWQQLSEPFQLESFPGDGGEFLLPLVRLKYWPVEYGAQAAVWAARELRERHSPAAIGAIEVSLHAAAFHSIGEGAEKWDPRTRETADHSLPYVFARTLLDGSIGVQSFDDEAVLDPRLRPVMARIRVRADEACDAAWPSEVLVRVVATTQGGERTDIEVRNPRGHEGNPMTRAEISEKFHLLAGPMLTPEQAGIALDGWWSVTAAETLAPLLNMLAPSARE